MDSSINPYASPEHDTPTRVDDEPEEETTHTFQSAQFWGMIACLGIAANVLLALAGIGIALVFLKLYAVDEVEQINSEIEDVLLYWDNVQSAAMLTARLFAGVAFLVWTYRAYRNLLALGHTSVDWKPWIAPFCWFIPIFNLIAPCLVMRELCWRSDPQAEQMGKDNPSLQTVNLWWSAWIGVVVLSWIANWHAQRAVTLSEHVLLRQCNIALFLTMIVSGILAIWIIISIDSQQLRRYAALVRSETETAPK